jgi:hypothetical protein
VSGEYTRALQDVHAKLNRIENLNSDALHAVQNIKKTFEVYTDEQLLELISRARNNTIMPSTDLLELWKEWRNSK